MHPGSRAAAGPAAARRPARGFTLIELLVVVAIIALLMSILLPSLRVVRESARAVVCGQKLRDLGNGLQTYIGENNDWIPGTNTTGVWIRCVEGIRGAFNKPRMPVQSFDWITPILSPSLEMQAIRAKRFKEIMNQFLCPSQQTYRTVYYKPGLNACPDKADFVNEAGGWTAISYLMPTHFQLWGTDYRPTQSNPRKILLGTHHANPNYHIYADVPPDNWEAGHERYKSRLQEVGSPAQKIAAADGTRYLDGDLLDFDPDPTPELFGAFTSSGTWWCGSTAYGVRSGTQNWNGHTVSAGVFPRGRGKNLALSYRHGPQRGAGLSGSAHDNRGRINAVFFDGSVRRFGDRQSRNPVHWYPRGTLVKPSAAGQVMIEDVAPGGRIP